MNQRNLLKRDGRTRRARMPWLYAAIGLITLAFGLFSLHILRAKRIDAAALPATAAIIENDQFTPQTLNVLLNLHPASLAGCDIARMNLLCAEGLQGAQGLDVEEQLRLLDGLARHVERETLRHSYRFRQKPEQFNHSEPIYRMMMLVTVLQEDIGARYNPDRISPVGVFEENDLFFANAEDVFIHGLIGDKRMGTCASLPVFYVAVGRRLGYPLKLVPTKNHLFVRWEDSRHRFNVDATGRGFHHFDDNHYRQWPFRISRQEEEEMLLLKSLTSAEELAVFLNLRGQCLMRMGHSAPPLSTLACLNSLPGLACAA